MPFQKHAGMKICVTCQRKPLGRPYTPLLHHHVTIISTQRSQNHSPPENVLLWVTHLHLEGYFDFFYANAFACCLIWYHKKIPQTKGFILFRRWICVLRLMRMGWIDCCCCFCSFSGFSIKFSLNFPTACPRWCKKGSATLSNCFLLFVWGTECDVAKNVSLKKKTEEKSKSFIFIWFLIAYFLV